MRHSDRIHRRLRVRDRGGWDLGWPSDGAFHRGNHINDQILAADPSWEKIRQGASDGTKRIFLKRRSVSVSCQFPVIRLVPRQLRGAFQGERSRCLETRGIGNESLAKDQNLKRKA